MITKIKDRPTERRKVNILLHLLGAEGIKLYNTFQFREGVAAYLDNGIEEVLPENKVELDTVLSKFDVHYGHRKFISLKRQAFLDRN